MSYLTEYTLNAPQRIIDYLLYGCENARYALDEEGYTLESTQWYEHKKDMEALSEAFLSSPIILSGTGEDFKMWREYYLHGRMIRRDKPEIVWPKPPKTWTRGNVK